MAFVIGGHSLKFDQPDVTSSYKTQTIQSLTDFFCSRTLLFAVFFFFDVCLLFLTRSVADLDHFIFFRIKYTILVDSNALLYDFFFLLFSTLYYLFIIVFQWRIIASLFFLSFYRSFQSFRSLNAQN